MASITRNKRKNRNDQRQRVVAALLEATERLIAGGSRFTEISVDTLSHEAGIARSTYYMYFQDKGHLIRELTAQVTTEVMDGLWPWWNVAPQATRAQLRRALLATLRIYQRHRTIFAALAETAAYDATVEMAFEELLATIAHRTFEAVRPGQKGGTVRLGTDLDTVLALVWMSERVAYRRLVPDSAQELNKATSLLTRVIWHALYRIDA
jgi:AcrR family transcriptional regulator